MQAIARIGTAHQQISVHRWGLVYRNVELLEARYQDELKARALGGDRGQEDDVQ